MCMFLHVHVALQNTSAFIRTAGGGGGGGMPLPPGDAHDWFYLANFMVTI